MMNFTNQFPDLDPGYEEDGIWRKPASPNELAVYQELGPSSPRILRFKGVEIGELLLEYHAKGNLWEYLLSGTAPLETRIGWALEIAEGIAYLHSKSVVWADGHFGNVLVTEDLHVVLADFAFSVMNPEHFHWYTTQPPPIFNCPIGRYGPNSNRPDIFSFGVMLFGLLANRFPWTTTLATGYAEQSQAAQRLSKRVYDTLDDEELEIRFGPITRQCFDIKYESGTDILEAMRDACASWRQRGESIDAGNTSLSLAFDLKADRSTDGSRNRG
ncbi:kinase-like domain-containing protein [Mycena vulgaris]|nr:kinase-like domain-containing protein [Mycena vulgaris]